MSRPFLCLLCVLLIQICGGTVTVEPTSQIIKYGSTASFDCCTDQPETLITWRFAKPSSEYQEYIYDGVCIWPFCNSRFTIAKVHPCIALSIRDTRLSDSGTYTCADQDGMGPEMNAELVVFESRCFSNVFGGQIDSVNVRNVPESLINASCRFNYTGNVRLFGQWLHVYRNQSEVIINSSTAEQTNGGTKQVTFSTTINYNHQMHGEAIQFQLNEKLFNWSYSIDDQLSDSESKCLNTNDGYMEFSSKSIESSTFDDALSATNYNVILLPVLIPAVIVGVIAGLVVLLLCTKSAQRDSAWQRRRKLYLITHHQKRMTSAV